MAIGYYMALYNLDKTELLVLGAFGFAFLTWMGSGADILGILQDWYRRKIEAERTPTIDYRGVFKINYQEESGGRKYINTTYYLRIEMVSGVGMINNCRASITVQQTPVSYAYGTWRGTTSASVSISKARPEFLELFTVNERDDGFKKFIFYSASAHGAVVEPYTDTIVGNVLSIIWGSENGNMPELYTKTIQNIMDEAQFMVG